MTGPDFLDTNVLVYSYDSSDSRKQRIAQELLRRAVAGYAVVSVQVLAEFAATLLHKLARPAKPAEVESILDALLPIHVVTPDASMVRRAIEARAKYGLHFHDGMVVAAAERGGCGRILSEDLNPGQFYLGVAAVNPFA